MLCVLYTYTDSALPLYLATSQVFNCCSIFSLFFVTTQLSIFVFLSLLCIYGSVQYYCDHIVLSSVCAYRVPCVMYFLDK